MLRTQIQIEENQIRWLRDRTKERGVSVSQLIREGVAFYRKYEDRLPEKKRKHSRPLGVMHQEFPTNLKSMMIVWLKPLMQGKDMRIDNVLRNLAFEIWFSLGRRKLSLVDCSGFVLMRHDNVEKVFGFDKHFTEYEKSKGQNLNCE